jgi:hypothetical protein
MDSDFKTDSSAPAGNEPGDPPRPDAPSEAFRAAFMHIAELKEYVRYYIDAKLDALKLTATNIAMYAILGLFGATAGVMVVIMAVVLLMYGIADGIGSFCRWAFGGPGWWWIGPVAVGLLVVGTIVVAAVVSLKTLAGVSHRKLVSKYEDRQRRQRASFGKDVEGRRAADPVK